MTHASPGSLHVVCPHCRRINRLPPAKLGDGGSCGVCHRPLFLGQPLAVDAAGFERFVQKGDLPVLVDFWAPWCGPCRMMAPQFEQAAALLGPSVQLLKLNTEEVPEVAAQFGIRSIPTLALFHQGKELARVSGAMQAQALVSWTRQHLPASAA